MGLGQRVGLIAGIVGALGLGGAAGYSYFVPDTIETTVTDTETKHDTYLIYTEAGTFKNTDAWYRGKFKASDMQGDIKALEGKKVEITKYGWRSGLLSMYENIVEIKEIDR